MPKKGKKVRIIGKEKISVFFQSSSKRQRLQLRANLLRASALLYRKTQEIVPVDTTALKRSGRILPLRSTKNTISSGVGYGSTVDYAIYVHEIAEYYHKPPTSWKYLERPFRENQSQIRRIVRGDQ
jgi:hypothetical protein